MRRLLPRTLLGRTVLVLIATVVVTQLVSQWVFRHFVTEEYNGQVVRVASYNMAALREALEELPPAQRAAYAAAESAQQNLQILPVEGNPLPAGASHELPDRLAQLEERLNTIQHIPVSIRIESNRQPQRAWVRLPVTGGDWWVRFERARLDRAFPLSAGLLLVGSIALAVAVAWITVRRLNQPLRAVQKNVLALSRGVHPAPVPVGEGPAEISDLALAVNRTANALRLAEKERALLLAGVSHDLRTPLSRLRLGLEMLTYDLPHEQQDLVQDIEEIDRIIEQFLDFARDPEALPASQGDLSQVARECAARAATHMPAVETDCQDGLIMRMRRPAVDRLINNLLENARRYGKPPYAIRTWRADDRLLLSVLDRGAGIPPDQVDRLLQPFTRLDISRGGPSGAGLGLAIVDRIARAHGGRLELHNRANGGLEARVSFRAEKRDDPPGRSPNRAPQLGPAAG